MERIWGPVNGFYFAAYAAPTEDGERYCSYAKVCWSRPDSYWDADCVFKIFGGEHHHTAEAALGAVAQEARNEVSLLPSLAQMLAEQQRRHKVRMPRLFIRAFFRHRMA